MIENQDILQLAEVFAALVFVVGMMILFGFVFKKITSGDKIFAKFPKKRLRVLETHPIDSRHKLVLIQCDNKQYLLHIGGQNGSFVIDQGMTPGAAGIQNNKKDHKKDPPLSSQNTQDQNEKAVL